MTATITQETAYIVESLARSASVIGIGVASTKINLLIADMLTSADDESIAEALRQDNAALQQELTSVQNSSRTMAENLELLRDRMAQITLLATAIPEADQIDVVLSQIHELAAPIDVPAEA